MWSGLIELDLGRFDRNGSDCVESVDDIVSYRFLNWTDDTFAVSANTEPCSVHWYNSACVMIIDAVVVYESTKKCVSRISASLHGFTTFKVYGYVEDLRGSARVVTPRSSLRNRWQLTLHMTRGDVSESGAVTELCGSAAAAEAAPPLH